MLAGNGCDVINADRYRSTGSVLFPAFLEKEDFMTSIQRNGALATAVMAAVLVFATSDAQAFHRRGGNSCGSWGGGGVWGGSGSGGSWGGSNRGTPAYGMMTVSNPAGCVAYRGIFDGIPGDNGEC